MVRTKHTTPKTQVEILTGIAPPTNTRALDIRRDNDNVKDYSVGLKDIDNTIIYYFNNVIRPYVTQNGNQVNVPIFYGSGERWASVQKNAFLRDKNGKIQVPVIVFKRQNVEKDRSLANKLDANNPRLFQVFEAKYTKKNVYDKFSVLTNRIPVKELYGVIMPEYVTITYECIIWTEYVEQMNKIVESINFASDSYWGEAEKFQFRTRIDNYNFVQEVSDGEERAVRTNFTLVMHGYIVPDTINKQIPSSKSISKFFTKAAVTFDLEVDGVTDVFTATNYQNKTVITPGQKTATTANVTNETFTYLNTNITKQGTYVSATTARFSNTDILKAPGSLPATTVNNFSFFVNGQYMQPGNIVSFSKSGNDLILILNTTLLGFELESTFEIIGVGKFTQ
jgi:hypothetical protein